MGSTWMDASEVACGLVLTKRISTATIHPDMFDSPYRELIKDLKNNESPEDLYLKHMGAYDVAIQASESINGSHDVDWIEVLQKSRAMYEGGQKLARVSNNLLSGKSVSLATVRDILTNLETEKTGRQTLTDIEPSEIPFVKTGWPAYDEHLGGIPEVGLVVVSGYPGAGKTSWVIQLAKSFATEHKKKNVAFFSLEMIDSEISLRFKEIAGSGKYSDRIQVNCDPLNVHEVVNDAAQIDDLGLVIVDFADYLVRGESTESSVGEIYSTLAVATKQLRCPVVLLAQYSYKYQGGFPRIFHIRYTSLAGILGWMLICLWNPHVSNLPEDAEALRSFPLKNGKVVEAAALVWKVRGGFREHRFDSPGAIKHQFKGNKGWSPTGQWFHLRNH